MQRKYIGMASVEFAITRTKTVTVVAANCNTVVSGSVKRRLVLQASKLGNTHIYLASWMCIST